MLTPLHHRCWGVGPPLVMLHGLFGSMENLGVLTRQLQQQFCVYGVDLPNHGRSPHRNVLSLPSLARDLAAWMGSVELEWAHFLGHSLGGKAAMELALRYPRRVQRLVVMDIAPVAYRRRHDDVFAGLRAVKLQAITSRSEADNMLAVAVSDPTIRGFLLKNLYRSRDQWHWRIDIEGLARDYEQLIAANSAGLPPFTGPVLFIKGADSDYLAQSHKTRIRTLFPRAAVKVVHNTGHWLHAEKPEVVANIIQPFLSQPDAGAGINLAC